MRDPDHDLSTGELEEGSDIGPDVAKFRTVFMPVEKVASVIIAQNLVSIAPFTNNPVAFVRIMVSREPRCADPLPDAQQFCTWRYDHIAAMPEQITIAGVQGISSPPTQFPDSFVRSRLADERTLIQLLQVTCQMLLSHAFDEFFTVHVLPRSA